MSKRAQSFIDRAVGGCPCAEQHIRENSVCHVVNGKRLQMRPYTGGPVRMVVEYRGREAVAVRFEHVAAPSGDGGKPR